MAWVVTAIPVVVSPLLGVLYGNLNTYLKKEFGPMWDMKERIEKLCVTLCRIKYVLSDAEERQFNDMEIRNWLMELREVSLDAEDTIDEWMKCQLASEIGNNRNVLDKAVFRLKIGKDVKNLEKQFDKIAKDMQRFRLQERNAETRIEICKGRETGHLLTETHVYGRDNDTHVLVELLLNNVNTSMSVCPIIGIPGVGKTTLAQVLYDHARVRDHFQVRCWVYVSKVFDVKHILKAIITSVSKKACVSEELHALQCCMQNILANQKFFIVFDDVWEEKPENWIKLLASLRCGADGSSILLTTRLATVATVASIACAVPPYHLQVLSNGDCLSLFKQRAFGLRNEEIPALVEIGKGIVERCGGIPLAAIYLGGLLRLKREVREWLYVKDSNIWELPQSSENDILVAFRSSYDHLPLHVKQCFLYCSIFPRDYIIEKQNLIQLWISSGLVPIESPAKMELEDMGNEIFNVLLKSLFFGDIEEDRDGNIKSFKIHPLVLDLAYSIVGDEYLTLKDESAGNVTERTRHVSLYFKLLTSSTSSTFLGQLRKISSPRLRSLISLHPMAPVLSSDHVEFICSRFIRLRTLDFSCTSIEVIPDSIGQMKQLRYLNCSHTCIRYLPQSICSLHAVQTLKLEECELVWLPLDMRKMTSLRHLDITECRLLTMMPTRMGELTSLQTLSFFIVGTGRGNSIKELQRLKLGGKLKITGLENVGSSEEAKGANLIEKEKLLVLELSWSWNVLSKIAREVIEGLQPHANLSRLSVEEYGGETLPNWLKVSAVPNLVEITLLKCERCACLLPLGKLPRLKILTIESMDSVRFIDDEVDGAVTGFSSLEGLALARMPKLERWSRDQSAVHVLPSLQTLSIEDCPKLTGVPLSGSPVQKVILKRCNNRILESLQNLDCLYSLETKGFVDLHYFPRGMVQSLSALTELTISDCGVLVSLPEGLGNLFSLQTLTINRCEGLQHLPELQIMRSLVHLTITKCRELRFSMEDFQHLVLLQTLTLENLPNLTCFPEGIKHAIKLQCIKIWLCSREVDLPDWIGALTLLQSLIIHGCKNRKELPEGMKQLTHLTELRIQGCDVELETRCERDVGNDWYKIAHVISVYVSRDI